MWLSVPLCMPGLWRDGRAVACRNGLAPAWRRFRCLDSDRHLCFRWQGGGLYLTASSSATITSSTISGNSAVSFACAPLGALCCLCYCIRPDVLSCAGCVLVGCVAVIGWSVGVVWVSRHEQNVSLCRGVLRWCVAVCAAVHAGAVARRASSGLRKPAEWLACMRVLKTFLHVSACPDVLLCAGCFLVGCMTVIGWSVGVVGCRVMSRL